jgi:hypothetical protein
VRRLGDRLARRTDGIWLACGEVVFKLDGKSGKRMPAYRELKANGVEFSRS